MCGEQENTKSEKYLEEYSYNQYHRKALCFNEWVFPWIGMVIAAIGTYLLLTMLP